MAVSVTGYSFELVEPEHKSGLLCAECGLILKEAVQTEEGVRLCHGCYEEIAKMPGSTSTKTGVCVLDEDSDKPTCYPDKAVRREVNQLNIFCENKKFGCNWIGRLLNYVQAHQDQCEFIPVECPNKSKGCEEKVPESQLKTHLKEQCQYRDVKCEHCGLETIAKNLDTHYEGCADFPLKCQLCEQTVPRKQMAKHKRYQCSKFRCVCEKEVEREGDKENSAARHFGLTGSPSELLFHFISLVTLTKTIMDDMQEMQNRIVKLEMQSQAPPQLLLTDHVNKQELTSAIQEIKTSIQPLQKRQVNWDSEQKKVDSTFQAFQRSLDEMDKKSKQQDAMISSLKTRLEQQILAASWDTPSHMTSGRTGLDSSRAILIEKKYEELERQVASLKVHVSELELQLQASLASTYNGALLWRIPDIHRRRRDAIDERITSIYSPPFYTGRNGYKMCIRAYLNGDGMGYKTHLSLFFVVMKGEYDALLKWPFEYKVSLILVDQTHRKHIVQTFKPTPDSNSFQRPTTDMNTASGCPTFSKLTALEDQNYVKDDVIFIKCIVDTSKIFHP